jgi:hypothetical protein
VLFERGLIGKVKYKAKQYSEKGIVDKETGVVKDGSSLKELMVCLMGV